MCACWPAGSAIAGACAARRMRTTLPTPLLFLLRTSPAAFCIAFVSLSPHFCIACVSFVYRFRIMFVPLLSRFCLAFVSLMSRCLSRCQLPAHLRVWGEGGNGGKRRGVGRGEGCEDAEEVAKVFSGPTTGLPWQRWRFSACASLGLGRPAECLGGTPAASEPPEAEVGVLRGAVQEQGSHGSSYGERA